MPSCLRAFPSLPHIFSTGVPLRRHLWQLAQVDRAQVLYCFTYEQADQLLYHMVDLRFDQGELHGAGFDPDLVTQLARRVARNHFKRMPPPIAKLSRRTINQDFRYLRDWN